MILEPLAAKFHCLGVARIVREKTDPLLPPGLIAFDPREFRFERRYFSFENDYSRFNIHLTHSNQNFITSTRISDLRFKQDVQDLQDISRRLAAIMFILYILLNKLLEKQALIPQRQNIH